ncbi:hypothetical protein AB0N17_46020 [Streptomyces sp. NPDC051133]|uniref:hypothetical protein n=1 Tax=Streptomyces sp. NPDC051133 TaxID=3155521 RepID=UPI003422D1CC
MKRSRLAVVAIVAAVLSVGGLDVASAATLAPTSSQGAQAKNPHESLSFLGMANIAVSRVRALYPDAELLEGQGKSPAGSTDDVTDITEWRFIFRLPGNRTATIQSTGWGAFSAPVVVDQPWLGDQKIEWSPENFLGIREADDRLTDAGYTDAFKSITFRAPLYPGIDEPYYIFNFTDGSHIAVGVIDGEVVPFH